MEQVQYISNANSKVTGVIVPIELWREIESERETARLLRSETMKRRLLEAKNREAGIPLNDVCTQLGI
jgi:PHD/YefM family antitoxin component YafN of YafNO toxin-antitoxin module